MPFSNAWGVNIPAGTVQAKLIDDHIRQLRLDIEERMEATLFVDFATDPLVLKDEITGKKDSKKLIIPHTDFQRSDDGTITYGFGYAQFDGAGSDVHVPIRLPPGVTVTLIEVLLERSGVSDVTWELYTAPFGAAAAPVVPLFSINTVTAGKHISASAALTQLIDENTEYYLLIDSPGTSLQFYKYYGTRVTYNAPTHRTTV